MTDHPMVGVGMPAALHLDAFGREIDAAFGHLPYLVGTAAVGKTWRDVDVRLIREHLDEAWKLSGPSSADAAGRRTSPANTARAAVCSEVRRLQDCTAAFSSSDGGPLPALESLPRCRASYEATLPSR